MYSFQRTVDLAKDPPTLLDEGVEPSDAIVAIRLRQCAVQRSSEVAPEQKLEW